VADKSFKYRVGVVGCGRKGTVHARSFDTNPLAKVVAGADPDKENLDIFTKRFNCPGYSSYQEMLQKEKIDIVLAILPVSPNPSVVIGCAEMGVKAIQCEKPMAASLADADRMVEVCRKNNVKLAVGDLDRNITHYHKAMEYIRSGAIGEVQSIIVSNGAGVELAGGGIQQFSLARLFAGDVDAAWAIGWVNGDPNTELDMGGSGIVRFVNGVEAFFTKESTAKYGYEVLCTKGTFYADGQRAYLWKTKEGAHRRSGNYVEPVEGVLPTIGLYENRGTYDAEGWRYFPRNNDTAASLVEALDKGIEPRANGDNGRKALELAIAFRESARLGHVPVRLPLPNRNIRMVPAPTRMGNKKESKEASGYMISLMSIKK